jgi:hypothetical protein
MSEPDDLNRDIDIPINYRGPDTPDLEPPKPDHAAVRENETLRRERDTVLTVLRGYTDGLIDETSPYYTEVVKVAQSIRRERDEFIRTKNAYIEHLRSQVEFWMKTANEREEFLKKREQRIAELEAALSAARNTP